MALFGELVLPREAWSNTTPYRYFTGYQSYNRLDHNPSPPLRAEIQEYHLGHRVMIESLPGFDQFGAHVCDKAQLCEDALSAATQIFDAVRQLVNTDEVYTLKLARRFLNDNGRDLALKAVELLLQPQSFIIEQKRYYPQHLAHRQLVPPDTTIWIEFLKPMSAEDHDMYPLTQCNPARRVITLRLDAPLFALGMQEDKDAQLLSTRSVHAGRNVADVLRSVTPVLMHALAQIVLQLPDSAANADAITASSITQFFVLSYLQAKHPFLDLLSHPAGIITTRNPAQVWSPLAQQMYRTLKGREPPVAETSTWSGTAGVGAGACASMNMSVNMSGNGRDVLAPPMDSSVGEYDEDDDGSTVEDVPRGRRRVRQPFYRSRRTS